MLEGKDHGRGKRIEGNFTPDQPVVAAFTRQELVG